MGLYAIFSNRLPFLQPSRNYFCSRMTTSPRNSQTSCSLRLLPALSLGLLFVRAFGVQGLLTTPSLMTTYGMLVQTTLSSERTSAVPAAAVGLPRPCSWQGAAAEAHAAGERIVDMVCEPCIEMLPPVSFNLVVEPSGDLRGRPFHALRRLSPERRERKRSRSPDRDRDRNARDKERSR